MGEGFVVEVIFFQGAGEVVFYEDVAFSGEGVEGGYSRGGDEGEAEGLFVAIYGEVVCAFSWELAFFSVEVGGVWWAPAPCVIAASWMLNLDDLCPLPTP